MNYALRSYDIRQANEKLVLKLVFQNERISQSQVVQLTGLKAPTVFRIFAKLEEAGFIHPCNSDQLSDAPEDTDRKGRRPSYYCADPTSGYAVGVDFSRVGVSVILVDFCNTVIYRDTKDFADDPDGHTTLRVIDNMISTALSASGVAADALIGIGIAAPGLVDTDSGTVLEYPRIPGLSGYRIGEHFESRYEAPVYVHNNASVIASSAYHYGAAQEEASLLSILVRFGVGAGFINHGEIFLNGTHTALEIGRTTTCCTTTDEVAGDRATLETFIAEQPLLSRLQQQHPVKSWTDIDAHLSIEQVNESLEQERLMFAMSIRNLFHVFHPDAVLIVSRYRLLSEFLGTAVCEAVPEVRVIPMVYDPVQACYGATDLVFRHFFRVTPGQVGEPQVAPTP